MKEIKVLLFVLLFFNLPFLLFAQQSSKTKAANKLYEKGGEVEVINATKINSKGLDFSPAYYQNGIVFASSRYKNGERDKKINETYFELFYAEMDEDGVPLEPKDFSLQVNSHLHEGPVSFNRRGDLMYFTRNHINKGVRKANSKGQTVLKIYEAKKGPTDWKDVVELSFCDDEYNYAHPSLSADGSKLFFASDAPGGMGGMDLYMVERVGDQWSTPVNLGKDVNTAGNEVFPFIHSSGNLFFSSNGWSGAGGLDLFMVDIGSRKWGQVTNLGEPFNSERDDLGLILDPAGNKGYFSSNRRGGAGKDDIYMFIAPEGIWGRTRPSSVEAIIAVQDELSRHQIEGAQVQIFEKNGSAFIDQTGAPIYESILLPDAEGSEKMVLKRILKNTDQLNQKIYLTNARGKLDYTFEGEQEYLILVSLDGFESREVLFVADASAAAPTISVALEAQRCVDINGLVASDAGEGLAKAAVKIRNNCNQEEELLVADAGGNFSHCLPAGCNYTLIGIKENYAESSIDLNDLQNTGAPITVKMELLKNSTAAAVKSISTGSVIVLENIYYDFNKSYIRTGDAAELDELLEIMQRYPSMKIELSLHTDSRGPTKYNRRLSMKRAESAMQYLVARGVAFDRVQAVGYGESKLRNHCRDGVSCDEEEHQYNRRTEVKVIELDESVEVQYQDNSPKVIDRRN